MKNPFGGKKYPSWISEVYKETSQALLKAIFDANKSLDIPFDVDSFTYFKTKQDAEEAQKELQAAKEWQFKIEQGPPIAEGEVWVLLGHTNGYAFTKQSVNEMDHMYEYVAKKYNGIFDGWGCKPSD